MNVKQYPGYILSAPHYSVSAPYGIPSLSTECYVYYLTGSRGVFEIHNYLRRGDYYIRGYNPTGKYYKRLGNAIREGIRQLEQNTQ